jgi:hypothetical protein
MREYKQESKLGKSVVEDLKGVVAWRGRVIKIVRVPHMVIIHAPSHFAKNTDGDAMSLYGTQTGSPSYSPLITGVRWICDQ